MLTLHGQVEAGIGCAREAILAQVKVLENKLPGLGSCYPGTVNIRLEMPLFIRTPSFKSSVIQWSQSWPPEEVSLTKATLYLPKADQNVEGWIYQPSLTPHRFDPSLIELLCPTVKFEVGDPCRIRLDEPTIVEQFVVIE